MNRRQFTAALVSSVGGVGVTPLPLPAPKPKMIITGDLGVVAGRLLHASDWRSRYEIVGIDKKRGSGTQNLNVAALTVDGGSMCCGPLPHWSILMQHADVVVHLAWEVKYSNPRWGERVEQVKSITATDRLLASIPLTAHTILASSVSVDPGRYGFEDHTPNYRVAKRWLEETAKIWREDEGRSVCVLRIGPVLPSYSGNAWSKEWSDDYLAAAFNLALTRNGFVDAYEARIPQK